MSSTSAAGDKIPRKGGPAITRSDLLIINKIDLAPLVGRASRVMSVTRARCAARAPSFYQPQNRRWGGEVVDFVVEKVGCNSPALDKSVDHAASIVGIASISAAFSRRSRSRSYRVCRASQSSGPLPHSLPSAAPCRGQQKPFCDNSMKRLREIPAVEQSRRAVARTPAGSPRAAARPDASRATRFRPSARSSMVILQIDGDSIGAVPGKGDAPVSRDADRPARFALERMPVEARRLTCSAGSPRRALAACGPTLSTFGTLTCLGRRLEIPPERPVAEAAYTSRNLMW